jgi:hypothetical protein
MPDNYGYQDLLDWLTGWDDETFMEDFEYDISEQNPYLSEYQFTQPSGMVGPSFQGYQGIPPDIMNALMGALDFGNISQFTLPDYFEGDPLGISGGEYQMSPDDMDFSLSTALGFTDIFDPESIAHTLSQLGGLTGTGEDAPIRAGEVRALTPEMIEKTGSAYYEPYETSERGELVDKFSKEMMKAPTGGFAGSGTRQAGISSAEQLYRGGYTDILKDIMKMRGGATEDVMDLVYGWQELMSGQ